MSKKSKRKTKEQPRNEIGDLIPPRPSYCLYCGVKLTVTTRHNKARLVCPNGDFVYRDNPVPVAVLLIPTDDDGVVLIRRKDDPRFLWLPGGYVDKGEHPEQAAIREAVEETALHVEIDRLLGIEVPEDENVVALFYLCKPVTSKPIAHDDALDARVYYRADAGSIDCIYTKHYVDQFFAEKE